MATSIEDRKHSRNIMLSQLAGLATKGQTNSTEYRRLDAACTELEATITLQEKIASRSAAINADQMPTRVASAVDQATRQAVASTISSMTPALGSSPEERRAKVDKAFRTFLRTGDSHAPEVRDLLTQSDATGGALIPQEHAFLTSATRNYGPIADLVAQWPHNSGSPVKFPIADDTASTMSLISTEGTNTSSTELDPTMSSTIPGSDTLVTSIKYSIQQLDDAVSLSQYLQQIAGARVARALDRAIITGQSQAGTALPSAPTGGLVAGITPALTTGTLAAGVTYANLVSLVNAVDYSYRSQGSFLVSPSQLKAFETTLLSTTGSPIYTYDENGVMVILGKKVFVSPSLPAAGTANAVPILFGDFSKQYAFSNSGVSIRVLRERFIDTLEQLFIVSIRIGQAQLLTNAVSSIKLAAS